MVQAE